MSSYFEPDPFTPTQASNTATAAVAYISGVTNPTVIRPSLANSPAPTSGVGAWVLGAYLQIVAPNDLASHMLVGAVFGAPADTQYDVEVATGTAGNEVVVWRTFIMWSTSAGVGMYVPCNPFVRIPANARVAMRIASIAGNLTINTKLMFIPRPLS